MRITAQEEYGLRCALQLANHREKRPLTSGEIARAEGMSVPYVNKLLHVLKRAGLIEAIRGNRGGYRLSREPARVMLADVLEALDGPLYSQNHCKDFPGVNKECVRAKGLCSIRSVWSVQADYIDAVLGRTSLEELGHRSEPAMTRSLKTKGQAVSAGGSLAATS
jgi:Rrf2 family protein